jgi:hypothetical protein
MGFGEQLRKLVESNGTSVYRINKVSKINSMSLHGYMKHGVDPTFSKIVELCEYFEISPNYFFANCSPEEFLETKAQFLPMVYLSQIPQEKREFVNDLLFRYARDYQIQLSHEKFNEDIKNKQLIAMSSIK